MNDDARIAELLEAADRGDAVAVAALLDSGMDANAHHLEEATALLMAARNGHVEVMRLLIGRGAHPNPDGSRDYTALTHAILWSLEHRDPAGRPDLVPLQLMLAAGAQHSLVDAVLANDLGLVRARLDAGEDPNSGEGSYSGPLLMEAARYGHVAMGALLLDRGADPEATDDLGQTALTEAARYNQLGFAALLLDRGSDIDFAYARNASALVHAAAAGHPGMVAFLIARGARRGMADALILGEADLFKALLEERFAAEPREELRNTGPGDDDRAPDEPECPARVDIWQCDGLRLAMAAAGRGHGAILQTLLDHGAAHLERWGDDHTLLAEASRHGHAGVARLLLDHGADVHKVGKGGRTPLSWAIEGGHHAVAELLRAAGAVR